MKITTGKWRAINGSEWTVVFSSEIMVCGHDGQGHHATWNPDGFCTSESYFEHTLTQKLPETVLRPWTWKEIPVGALYRPVGIDGIATSIVGKTEGATYPIKYVMWTGGKPIGEDGLQYALHNREHSTDGGKTWHPCGVMEGGAN